MAQSRSPLPSLSSVRAPSVALDFKDPYTIFMWVMLLVTVGIGVSYWFLSAEPTRAEIASQQERLTEKNRELDRILKETARKPEFEADVQRAQEELAILREMFPDEEKVPLRLNDLYIAIRQAGVRIVSFEPTATPAAAAAAPAASGDDPSSYYRENTYKLELEGGYHQIGDMFAEVANFDYPTRITDLRVRRFSGLKKEVEEAKAHGTIPVTMSVAFKLITFSSRK